MRITLAGWLLLAPVLLPGCGLLGGGTTPVRAGDGGGEPADAGWERAQRALAAGDDRGALADLLACCQRHAGHVRAHIAYQDCARRLGGASQQAMLDFYRQPAPDRSQVWPYLQARLAETAYAQANALDAILRADPKFGWAHLSRARVNRSQGRLLPALDMYAAAIACDPTLFEALVERAAVLAELGRHEEAAIGYRTYLERHPEDSASARDYVALLLYRLNRVDEAFPWLDRLQQALPNDRLIRMDRAAALWRANRPREAVETYLAILQEQPDMARAAWNVGLLYFDVVPRDDAQRRVYWPRARAAFEYFLRCSRPADGDEQFERTLGVPYRLERIAALIGRGAEGAPDLAALRWPSSPSP